MKSKQMIVAICIALPLLGFWLGFQFAGKVDPGSEASGEREILYYVAPMDASYRRDEPGKSPMGMDLVPVYADEVDVSDDASVRISPAVVSNLGIRTAGVKRGDLHREVFGVGYVNYDEDSLQSIRVRAEGWVERLHVVSIGDSIAEGQPLLEYYSPTLVNAQEDYLVTLNRNSRALTEAARERLIALGLGSQSIEALEAQRKVRRLVTVRAPKAGVVTELDIREGDFVDISSDILSIGSLENVWLLVRVLGRQSAWLRQGQSVKVSIDAMSEKSRMATIEYIYPEVDPDSRTAVFRVELRNDDRVLKPNMFAQVTVAAEPVRDAIHVPSSALIRGGRNDRLVLVNPDGSFRSQVVTVGIESGNRVQILSGISPNDTVVTSGQFLIDSESNIESALARTAPPKTQIESASRSEEPASMMAKIEAINVDDRTITLDHRPIEAWKMPAMTMLFDIDPEVDIERLEVGDSVHVQVTRPTSGRFLITKLHKMSERSDSDGASE